MNENELKKKIDGEHGSKRYNSPKMYKITSSVLSGVDKKQIHVYAQDDQNAIIEEGCGDAYNGKWDEERIVSLHLDILQGYVRYLVYHAGGMFSIRGGPR